MTELRITEGQLTEALEGFSLDIRDENCIAAGVVDSPERVARALYACLSANAAHRDPEPGADPEVAAMAAIAAVMEALDEHAGWLGTDVQQRVLRWANARWNTPA